MFDHKVLNELTAYDLNEITELRVINESHDPGAEILRDLRNAFVIADEDDRWDARRRRAETIHELADSAVPTYANPLDQATALVQAANEFEIADEFAEHAGRWMDWSNVQHGGTLSCLQRQALYLAFERALRLLVEWADDNAMPEDDSDD